MSEFFKPWRRKTGAASLVMALTAFALWMRGLSTQDDIRYGIAEFEVIGIELHTTWISWYWFKDLEEDRADRLLEFGKSIQWYDFAAEYERDKNRKWFWFFNSSSASRLMWRFQTPYWCLILPPTLLSTYLLLVKSHPKPNKTDDARNRQNISAPR